MSILNSVSSKSVYRGYNYFKEGNVISYNQISDDEYEGYVSGSNSEPYHVIINIKHPKKSYCNCPMANGNTTCKHMVAMFFAVSPDDLHDYEEWNENKYYDTYGEYDEEDDYDLDKYYDEYDEYEEENYGRNKTKFVKPMFFNELLVSYINGLSEQEAKEILALELTRNAEYAINTCMRQAYNDYLSDKNSIYSLLDRTNKKLTKMAHDYSYNYKDYTQKLLSKKEKEIVEEAYKYNLYIREQIDKIFLEPELATYEDYKWFANLYKNVQEPKMVKKYIQKLEMFLDTLKHYSIKNTVPKSNVLIVLYMLNSYNLTDIAENLMKNAKYPEYVEYILQNAADLTDLYKEIEKVLVSTKFINYESVANIYYQFYTKFEQDDDAYNKYLYYKFLSTKDINYLKCLSNYPVFMTYIDNILEKSKDLCTLEKVYILLDEKEKLFDLLYKEENEYRLIANIGYLKDKYNDELLNYFKSRIYITLEEDKNRKTYQKAAEYIGAIYKLNEGEKLVLEIIQDLKKSEYSKRSALFDEIDKVVIKINNRINM